MVGRKTAKSTLYTTLVNLVEVGDALEENEWIL